MALLLLVVVGSEGRGDGRRISDQDFDAVRPDYVVGIGDVVGGRAAGVAEGSGVRGTRLAAESTGVLEVRPHGIPGSDPPRLPTIQEELIASTPSTPQDRFREGYRVRAGGDAYLLSLLEHVVVNVIGGCECRSWDCGIGLHIGDAQFSPDTWTKARRTADADPLDHYEAGWATANWIVQIKGREGTSAGWPFCWHVGG